MAVIRAVALDATSEDIQAAFGTLDRLARAEVASHKRRAGAHWSDWVAKALANGASAAHRWSNAVNQPRLRIIAPGVVDPMLTVEHHTDSWAGVWETDEAAIRQAISDVAALRASLSGHDGSRWVESITTANMRKVSSAAKKRTGIGVDELAFTELAHASDEALDELGGIMKDCVRSLALPVQCLLTQLSLIAKKMGGTRAIALVSTFVRLLLSLGKDEVREWDCAEALPGDTGRPGVSLELESSRRHLKLEIAHAFQRSVVLILWDVEKFYDSSQVHHTIDASLELGFPKAQLALGLMSHRAPRVLKQDGCWGRVLPSTGRSMLAGCTYATSMARARIIRLRKQLPRSLHHTIFQQVDDLTQMFITEEDPEARQLAVGLGNGMADLLVSDGYRISPKSTVVASSRRLASAVAAGLRAGGHKVKVQDAADDVGVTTSAAGRRVVKSQRGRITKVHSRAGRVGVLAKQAWRAVKLHKTGCIPAMRYGGFTQGFAPATIGHMRTAAARAVPSVGPQPCVTTLLTWKLGDEADPAYFCRVGQVRTWIRLWEVLDRRDRLMAAKAWRLALPDVLGGKPKWNRAAGPIRATIYTLADVGWSPSAATKWFDENREFSATIDTTDPDGVQDVISAFALAVNRRRWRDAAAHFLGRGLEAGVPSLEPAVKARRRLVKVADPSRARALDMVVCGSAWMGGRNGLKCKCKWCGADETPLHRYWTCPRLDDLNDQFIKDTQDLITFAAGPDGFDRYPCLFGRALLPADLYEVGQFQRDVEDMILATTPNLSEVVTAAGEFFPDGSGGSPDAPHNERHHGSGVAAIKHSPAKPGGPANRLFDVDDVAVMAARVPGAQTVPRAELWAATLGVKAAAPGTDITVHPDATYVHQGISRCDLKPRVAGVNADAWERLRVAAEERSLSSERAPAHQALAALVAGKADALLYLGNLLADSAAGTAAARAQSTSATADRIRLWESRAYKIALRLATIEALHWEAGPTLVPAPRLASRMTGKPVVHAPDLMRRIEEAGHQLRWSGRARAVCCRCRKRHGARHFDEWFKPCPNPMNPSVVASTCAPKRRRDIAEDVPGTAVPPATRRRLMADIAKEASLWRQKEGEARGRAIQACMGMLPPSRVASLRAVDNLSFVPHDTHSVVACGGFAGCFRCGSVVGYHAPQTLLGSCRGHCPAGSRGPVVRLARGRLPHRQDGVPLWPTGEANPTPALYVRSARPMAPAVPGTPAVPAPAAVTAVPAPPVVEWIPTRVADSPRHSRARTRFRF